MTTSRRFLGALITTSMLVGLSSGCATRTQAWVAAGVGVTMASIGALATSGLSGGDEEPPAGVYVPVLGLLLGGALLAVTTGYQALTWNEAPSSPAPRSSQRVQPTQPSVAASAPAMTLRLAPVGAGD